MALTQRSVKLAPASNRHSSVAKAVSGVALRPRSPDHLTLSAVVIVAARV
jgi:hypothetical protein